MGKEVAIKCSTCGCELNKDRNPRFYKTEIASPKTEVCCDCYRKIDFPEYFMKLFGKNKR